MIEVTPDLRKKIQQKDLEILDEVSRVCSLLGITYMLSSGSALGAVRHQGFIPWDDDIDVMMPRVDYERFMHEAPAVMSPDFMVQSHLSEPEYLLYYMKVRANNTVMREVSFAKFKQHHGVYIDIFPLDRVADTRLAQRFETMMYRRFDALRNMMTWSLCRRPADPLRRTFRSLMYPIARLIGISRLTRWENRFRGRNRNNSACRSTSADCLTCRFGTYFDMALFEETVPLMFEGRTMPVMAGYDAYLRRLYGDYMTPPPEANRGSKHKLEELVL